MGGVLQNKKVHTEDTTSHGENKKTTYVTSTWTQEHAHGILFWDVAIRNSLRSNKKNTNGVTLNQPYGVKVRRQNALPTGGTHMHRGLCQTTKSAFIHHGFPEIRNKRTESYYKRRAHYGHFHTLTRMPNVCSMAIRLWDW